MMRVHGTPRGTTECLGKCRIIRERTQDSEPLRRVFIIENLMCGVLLRVSGTPGQSIA